jgi:hypothetical protein
MSAAGSLIQGYGANEAGIANQRIGERNATLMEQQAEDSLYRGGIQEQRQRLAGRKLLGRQRVGFAGQGVDVNSGTAALIQADTTAGTEMDALTIRNNAAREAYGLREGAKMERYKADVARQQGRFAAIGSIFNAGGQTASMFSGKGG